MILWITRCISYIKEHKYVLLVLYAPIYLAAFFLMEKLVPSQSDYWVSFCPLDDHIPFIEYFVVPYYLWYIMLFTVGIYLMKKDVPEFKRYMFCIITGFSFSIIFCILFPNGQNLRPEYFARDNIFVDLVKLIYASDTNTNVIPSVHALGAIFAAVSFCASKEPKRKWVKVLTAVLAVTVCLSTCFIKQHSILDVVASIAVSTVIYSIYRICINVKNRNS